MRIRSDSKFIKYMPLQPERRRRAIKNKILSISSAVIVLLSIGAVAIYFIVTLNYRFNEILSYLNTITINNTTDSIIYDIHSQRQLQKDIEIHYYPLGELSNMSEEVRSTAISLLLEEANDLLDQETSHVNKDMRDAYPDMRELEFHLRYAQEVERGIRGPELEPEWEWAANISIVYTWVNGSDPIHLYQKSRYNGGNAKPDNRDRCVDELRYSLRSLIKNLIWHKGTIYIVAPPNQVPEWLDPSFDRIKIIDQSTLLPSKNAWGEDVNPTFNSFAIEWYLDKIEGITEQFIQINDDYFFRRPVHPSLFFYGGGEAYSLNPTLVKPLTKNEKVLRERKKFNQYRKGAQKTETGIWNYLYGSKKREAKRGLLNNNKKLSEQQEKHLYRRSYLDYNNFVPLPDPMIYYAYDEEAMIELEKDGKGDIQNQNNNKENISNGEFESNKNNSIIIINDDYGQDYVLDLSNNGIYSDLIDKEDYEKKQWSSDFSKIDRDSSDSVISLEKESSIMERVKAFFVGNEQQPKTYSKTYYPNAARHFHFPNIYMENRRVDKNLNSYKRIGYKGTFETSWSDKFEAAEAITTFCLKSFFGEDIGINSLYHAPYVFYRDLYEPARELYREYLNLTLTHRFRDGFDILPPISKSSYLRFEASSPNFEKELDQRYNMTFIYSKEEEKNIHTRSPHHKDDKKKGKGDESDEDKKEKGDETIVKEVKENEVKENVVKENNVKEKEVKENEVKENESNEKEVKENEGKQNENKRVRSIIKYGFHIMREDYVKQLFTFGAIYNNCRHNERLFKKIMESETIVMYNLNDDYTFTKAGEQLKTFLKFMYPEPGPFEKKH